MGRPACGQATELLRRVVVRGVGTAVYVTVGLQAVLRRSHHVGGFHRRPESRVKRIRAAETVTTAVRFDHVNNHLLHNDDDVVDL